MINYLNIYLVKKESSKDSPLLFISFSRNHLEIKDFTNIPLDVYLERDNKRENPIGENIIRSIFNKYKELYNLKETSDE